MTTLATDAFTRADATSLGANWTTKRNNVGIFSNQCDITTTLDENIARYSAVTWPDDQWAQATCVVGAAANRIQAVGVRLEAAATRQGYYGGHDQYNSGSSDRRIWKYVGSVWTSLVSEAIAVVATDVLYLEVQGTALKLYVNGALRLSATDASLTTGQAGMVLGDAAGDVALLDDWSGGDFAGSGNPAIRRFGGVNNGRMGMRGVFKQRVEQVGELLVPGLLLPQGA